MKNIFAILLIVVSWGCLSLVNCQSVEVRDKNSTYQDSVQVANISLGFYNWYLNCLRHDSTYNIIQPLYHWKDTIPVIETQEYLKRLKEMGLVSDTFLNFEKERFRICQDSLNHIDYKAVELDGVSVGFYYKECDFIDTFYWLDSQESPDSCEIKEIRLKENTATCQLLFFWNSALSLGKQYDSNFHCNLNLRKYGKNWLIDSIDVKRN
jgi:hypothetical protein